MDRIEVDDEVIGIIESKDVLSKGLVELEKLAPGLAPRMGLTSVREWSPYLVP